MRGIIRYLSRRKRLEVRGLFPTLYDAFCFLAVTLISTSFLKHFF